MIRTTSKPNTSVFLKDFQVYKGQTEETMESFGPAVFTLHEARLMIQSDRQNTKSKSPTLYAIHQRSENKILQIIQSPGIQSKNANVISIDESRKASRFPLPKAA